VSDSPTDPVAEHIVAEATAAAREDETVLGLMIKGSLARGERYPGADIDLHALVVPGAGRATEVRMVEGVMVECCIGGSGFSPGLWPRCCSGWSRPLNHD
jgi:hypothetical protein